VKFLEGINLRTIRLMGIGGMLVVAAVGALLSIQPLIISINERNAEAAAIEAEKELIQSDFNRYSALQEFIPQMDATTEFLSRKFPAEVNSQGFIEQAYNAAEATGISANQIRGINTTDAIPIIDTSGSTPEAICANMEPGSFAKMVPDPQQDVKDPQRRTYYYVVCFEEDIDGTANNTFYNATSNNPARTCNFKLDGNEGRVFILTIGGCEEGKNVLPGINAETIRMPDTTEKFPKSSILAEVLGSVAKSNFTISVDSNIQIEQLTAFIENLYRMDMAVSIISVTVGSNTGGSGSSTVIRGLFYSHVKPITASEFIAAQAQASTEQTAPAEETQNSETSEQPVEETEEGVLE
jgi:hypothetical protein